MTVTHDKYYAQIVNGRVVNVVSGDPTGRFDSSIEWVECPFGTKIGDVLNVTTQSYTKPTLSLDEEKLISLEVIKRHYNALMSAITSEFDILEMITWSIQIEEANALLKDANAPALFLRALADERKIDLTTLAHRVIIANNMFRVATGRVTGRRQRLEDIIKAVESIEALQQVRRHIRNWQEEGLKL